MGVQGDQLASCSIDTTVVVWDTQRLAPLHTLRGHTSWVKGVAWDPAGTLLASQADDPSLIVWNLRTMTMQVGRCLQMHGVCARAHAHTHDRVRMRAHQRKLTRAHACSLCLTRIRCAYAQ